MIYSKFGSPLRLLNKRQCGKEGLLAIEGTVVGSTDLREYAVADLKADEGSREIEQAIAQLPWKTVAR